MPGLKNENNEVLDEDNIRFLVFGVVDENGFQKPITKEEVKLAIKEKYNADIDLSSVVVKDGKLTIGNNILTTENWNKVKLKGNMAVPYKITVLVPIDGTSKGKVAKIAFYQDGTASLETITK